MFRETKIVKFEDGKLDESIASIGSEKRRGLAAQGGGGKSGRRELAEEWSGRRRAEVTRIVVSPIVPDLADVVKRRGQAI